MTELDPRCTEEGVDRVLAHIKSWLLNPVARKASIPVIVGDTHFVIECSITDVRSWSAMGAEQTARTIKWLFDTPEDQ